MTVFQCLVAVMFTFSFSTAFAATITDSAEAYVDAAYTKALNDLKAMYDAVIATTDDTTVTFTNTVKVDEEVFEAVAAKVYADYQVVLADQYRQIQAADIDWSGINTISAASDLFTGTSYKANGTYVGTTLANAYYGEVDTVTEFVAVVTGTESTPRYALDLLKAQLAADKEYILGELGKVNLGAYSDTVIDSTDAFKTTYKEAAAQVVETIKTEVNAVSIASTDSQALAAWKIANLELLLGSDSWDGTEFTRTAGTAGGFTANLLPSAEYLATDNTVVVTAYVLSGAKYESKDIITSVAEGHTAADLAAAKAAAKATVAQKAAEAYTTAYNTYKSAGYTTAAKTTFDATQKEINAYKEVINYIIDEATAASTFANVDSWAVTGQNWAARVAKYAELEGLAATAKIITNKLGELVYDAAKIDENMEDLKWAVYTGTLTKDFDDVVANAEVGAADVAWAIEMAKADVEAYREAKLYDAVGEDIYFAPEAAQINALYDALIAKIEAATTVAQVEKLVKDVTVPSTVKTAAAIESGFDTKLTSGTLAGELTKAKTYLAYLNNGLTVIADGYRTIDDATLADVMAEVYAEGGARTDAEAKAMFAEACAAIEAYPTNAEMTASVAAVEAAVKALPKNITAADKEAVKAAYALYDDLTTAEQAKVKASVKTTLNNAVAATKNIEAKAITAAFKALPAVAKITAADKEAVKAAAALVEAYESEELYISGGEFANYETYNETTYLEAVRAAEDKAIEAQIYALGTDPTVAAVEAARAAYDAFVAEWTDAETHYNAKAEIVNADRLLYAEQVVAEDKAAAEEAAKKALIADIEGLKIKANSSAKKGSITVKWTVSEEVEGVKYQVYKSTKAQKGYKKSITTSKTSFKNTKNLTKGTRYYYKVRAIGVVDGVTYYSDWSNKANRIAK